MSEGFRWRDLGDEVEAEEHVNAANKNGDKAFELSVKEFQSQFAFYKSTKNYQDALDLNETYWEKISKQTARNGDNSSHTKLLDRDGDEISNETFIDSTYKRAKAELNKLEKSLEDRSAWMNNPKNTPQVCIQILQEKMNKRQKLVDYIKSVENTDLKESKSSSQEIFKDANKDSQIVSKYIGQTKLLGRDGDEITSETYRDGANGCHTKLLDRDGDHMASETARDRANDCRTKLLDRDGDHMASETARDGANSCRAKLLDRDGDKIANETSRDGANSGQTKLLDRDGDHMASETARDRANSCRTKLLNTNGDEIINETSRDGANSDQTKLLNGDGDKIANETSSDRANSGQTKLLNGDEDEFANETSRGDGTNRRHTKLLDRDGYEIKLVTTFGEYIVNKSQLLCEMGRLKEAKETCLKALMDLEEKTIHIQNGKVIKLSQTEVKSELVMVTVSLRDCLSIISDKEFDFEKAFDIEGLEVRLDAVNNHHNSFRKLMLVTDSIAKESLQEDFRNSKIIVNPSLENHYIDENGKFYVQSLDKALKIVNNGDSIFLKNGRHDLGRTEEKSKMTIIEKNVTIIGESTNESILRLLVPFHKRSIAEVQFKRLDVMIAFPIHVSQGKISFESCLVDSSFYDSLFLFDNEQAEIELHLCSFTSYGISSLIQLKNSDSPIKINIRNCSFADFKFIITDFRETSLRCGFDLQIESCSFLGIKLAMIALENFNPSQKEVKSKLDMIDSVTRHHITPSFTLTYPTSIVIRNCYVEVCSSLVEVSHIMDIDNASHVLIESTKFNAKRGEPADKEKVKRIVTLRSRINAGLRFANIQRVEINNVRVIRERSFSTLSRLQQYLEMPPHIEHLDDAAIQLTVVHEATIRDSIFDGFYCGISTQCNIPDVIYNKKAKKICFTGVYDCELSNMAVCVLLDSSFTHRSIFVLSDITLRESLVGVQVSKTCCDNGIPGCVDVLDTKFTNIASPIVVPKALKKDQPVDAKDEKKNLLSRFETKNLTFPDGGPKNVSRKKRRDDVIKKLMKTGVLDPTTSIPYLEKMFNPGGSYLEIANEKDLEPFNFEESRPQSTSDYQSDDNDSVD